MILIGLVVFLLMRDHQRDLEYAAMKKTLSYEVNRLGNLERGLTKHERKSLLKKADQMIRSLEFTDAAMGGSYPEEDNDAKNSKR